MRKGAVIEVRFSLQALVPSEWTYPTFYGESMMLFPGDILTLVARRQFGPVNYMGFIVSRTGQIAWLPPWSVQTYGRRITL